MEHPAPGREFLVVQFRGPLPRWEAAVCGCPEEAEDSLHLFAVTHGLGFLCVQGRLKTPWASLMTCATTAGSRDDWPRIALAIQGGQTSNFALQKLIRWPAVALRNSTAVVVTTRVSSSGTWQLAKSRADAGRRKGAARGPRPSWTASLATGQVRRPPKFTKL